VEETIRLKSAFWCYAPPPGVPAVNGLPAERNGFITFGCLNNFCKVNDVALSAWEKVLRAVPGSRMRILAPEGGPRERVLAALRAERERIDFVGFVPRAEYLQQYHFIDFALDTYPFPGHTTAMESLYMGVPMVTLYGATAVSRGAMSLLRHLELGDLAAASSEEYVERAIALANDVERLRMLRQTLRGRMERSIVMDGAAHARAVEEAYLAMWKRWCDHPIQWGRTN
jgi:protein O-GlcNAc transferase